MSTNDREQSDNTPQEKGDPSNWRHVGKIFAIGYFPWLQPEDLEVACRLEAHDLPSQDPVRQAIFQLLNECNIKPDVRTNKHFQSEVGVYLFFHKILLID